MSIFNSSDAKTLDDYVKLTVTIEGSQFIKDYTEYIIRVQRGDSDSWKVLRRYNDFVSLDSVLKIANFDLPLPPKKWTGNKDREFVALRQKELQNYLNVVLGIPLLEQSFPVKRFLDPSAYSFNFQEVALQHVSMVLRSESTFKVQQPVEFMGSRVRKCYFTAESALPQDRAEYIMAWASFGPFFNLELKDASSLINCLTGVSHPFICGANIVGVNKHGFYCVRQFERTGSLRDLICKAKPKGDCLRKYGRQKSYNSLSLAQIQSYGRQILEALKFLHSRNFPYGHLHLGNVLVTDAGCRLTDIENSLLGLSSFVRQRAVTLKRLRTFEEIDVYSFGHCLYEMATCQLLTAAFADTHTLACPTELKTIILSILTEDAVKSGLPTVAELLENPFFASTPVHYLQKPQWKIGARAKEVLLAFKAAQEQRLLEDQRSVSLQRRRSKVANMTEEERRMRRASKQANRGSQLQEQQETQQQQQQPAAAAAAAAAASSSAASASASAAAAAAAASPRQPPAAPPPPPPPPPAATSAAEGDADGPGRRALLSSISGFSKTALKKAVTNDRSQPAL